MQKTFDHIYKLDTKGKTRVWFMEQDGSRYRTHAGLLDGQLVTSEWTQAEATNVGRANERDPVAQATFEIEAAYEKKLTREYHRTLEGAAGGAHFFKPMLAEKYEVFAPGFAQPKLDGVRCIMTAEGGFSREGKPIPGSAHIRAQLDDIFAKYPSLILDGELYNHELKDNFNEVISLVKKASTKPDQQAKIEAMVQYHVYDAPAIDAIFETRYGVLTRLFDGIGVIKLVPTVRIDDAETFDRLHGEWLEAGYEGSMWRCPVTRYEQKRSKSLRKRKEFVDDEFEVVRIEEGLGNWSGMAKRVVCRLPDGREFGAGIKGTQARARELLHEDHRVVTIKFFAYTPDGVPRFPVATKFHGAERTL